MRKFHIAYLITMITLLGSTLAMPAHGAGSGGGGMGSGTYNENSRALTPQQKSAKAFPERDMGLEAIHDALGHVTQGAHLGIVPTRRGYAVR